MDRYTVARMCYHQGWDILAVQKICEYFYTSTATEEKGIGIVKRLLPVAAVCRCWRRFMLPCVYNTAYLDSSIKGGDKEPVLQSNIGLIVSLKWSHCVRDLSIAFNNKDGVVSITDALDSLGFRSACWSKVSRLRIDQDRHSIKRGALIKDDNDDIDSRELTRYFSNHTPNVRYLRLQVHNDRRVHQMFANKMADTYLNQLYELHTGDEVPITFSMSRFKEHITHLSVRMDYNATNMLPQVAAWQLHRLYLAGIPETFTWKAFYSDSPNEATFTNLQELTLQFNSETISKQLRKDIIGEDKIKRVINWDANARQLRFPKLTKLELVSNPYSDATFYSLFEASPLKILSITGSFKSMKNISAKLVLGLSDLVLDMFDHRENESGKRLLDIPGSPEHEEFESFTKQVFCWTSHAERVLFSLFKRSLPLSVPATIGWCSVRVLEIVSDIYLSSILQLVKQCPRLSRMFVGNITDDTEDIALAHYVILSQGLAKSPHAASMLGYLRVGNLWDNKFHSSSEPLTYLVLSIPSLTKLSIPENLVPEVEGFIARHSDVFSHLQKVEVCKDPLFSACNKSSFLGIVLDPFEF